MASSEMLRRVALVRTDVSEELIASFIRMTRIGELGTTLAVTSNAVNKWHFSTVSKVSTVSTVYTVSTVIAICHPRAAAIGQ
jgi:hypothetical protein